MLTRREALSLPAAGVLSATPLAHLLAADDPTKVFTGDKKPTDPRLGAPKTLNDYFPFVVPASKEAWEDRKKQLREQLLVANGLWPLPDRTPLNPVVHGAIDKGTYTIEKVYFVSSPGHYVCGNLYRPKGDGAKEKRPAVLFAHGHWADGRFHDAGEKAAKAAVAAKGEPDLDRGRFFMQALPATLAKLGFVVFHYDMVGYADSTAVPHAKGFADAEAELRLQSAMGLQTWNSLRALDFLLGLPDVDPRRVGMTGASGGGTQTFITAALDDRLSAAFPAVMVSTGMQGGCVCENCSYLRVNTGNVEIAAMFAPKPLAMSAANDWTKDILTKGYPELQKLYDLYGAKDKVAARAWLEYGHQYNVHAREMMYAWFLKHLAGKDEQPKEPGFEPLTPKELSVFDDKHPRPKDELDAPKLRAALTKASDAQMAKLAPKDAEGLKEFRRVVGTALGAMVQPDTLPEKDDISLQLDANLERSIRKIPGGLTAAVGLINRFNFFKGGPIKGDQIPFCRIWRGDGDRPAVIWVHPGGKGSLWVNGALAPAAKAFIDAGYAVVALDVLGVGEQIGAKTFVVDKTFAGYTYGYNFTLLAQRVRDVLMAARAYQSKDRLTNLVGWESFGPIAVLAKALAGVAVFKTAADLNGFDFAKVTDPGDPMMLPGAVKYGGLGAFLALCAPDPVLAHNHKGTETGQLARAAYSAAGAADKLTRSPDKLDPLKVVEWLVKS